MTPSEDLRIWQTRNPPVVRCNDCRDTDGQRQQTQPIAGTPHTRLITRPCDHRTEES